MRTAPNIVRCSRSSKRFTVKILCKEDFTQRSAEIHTSASSEAGAPLVLPLEQNLNPGSSSGTSSEHCGHAGPCVHLALLHLRTRSLSSLEPNVSAHRGLARAHTCCTRCRCSTHAEPLHGAHAVHRETRTLLAARPRRQIRKERKAGLSSLFLPWAIRAAWLPRRWALSRRRHHPHASHPSRARTAAQPACHQWTPTAPCLHPFGPRPKGVGG